MSKTIELPLPPAIEPNDLYYFAVVVETGSFTAAGRRLGLPKSRLSRRIAGLEQLLGVRLLQRTTRRMLLTEIGQQVWSHAQAMRLEVQAATDQVLAGSGVPRGKVRITSAVLMGQLVLTTLVPEFLLLYPEVSLEVELTNRRVDMIAEGLDLALDATTPAPVSTTLIRRTLGRTRPVLVASPRFIQRLGAPASVQDLARFPALAMTAPDGRYTLKFEGAHGAAAQVQVNPTLQCSDLSLLLAAAEAGVGFALLPEVLCGQAIQEHRLVQLLPAWRAPVREIHALYPSRQGSTVAARTFLDFLAQRIAPLPDQTA